MTSRRSRATLASVGLVTVCATTAWASSAAAVEPQALADAVTVEGVTTHLQAFQDIADANGGNRALGTAGYEASGAYVEQVLAAAGYETTRQVFEVTTLEEITYEFTIPGVVPDEDDFPDEPDRLGITLSSSPDTPEGGLTLPLIQPANAFGCDAAAWEGIDATGYIAVVSRGNDCPFSAKNIAAAGAGAEAIIVYNNVAGPLNGTLGAETLPEFIPGVGVSDTEGAQILAAYTADPTIEATFELDQEVVVSPTFNIIAETPTGRNDNTVMLGAHLDGVPEGPGINDNGSGSAALLETAVQLAEQGPLNNQVRFAWWGAEEVGLVGSTYYVDDLVANNPTELGEIATYLNFDMVGSPNYVISVYDADQSTYKVEESGIVIPPGSIETEDLFTDYFDSIGQPWIDSEFSGRSDYQAFIDNGVASSGLFTGADGSKTAAEVATFGGAVGEAYDQNYHAAGDDIDNINPEALGIMIKAIAFVTGTLANDTSSINGVLPPAAPGTPGTPGTDDDELAATGAADVDPAQLIWAFSLVGAGLIAVAIGARRRTAVSSSER